MKLKLGLHYKYNIILSLANKEIKMSKIEENILDAIKKYNSYSLKSVNKKKISHNEVDDNNDLLSIILESEKPLPIPVRGLRYFTQVIMDDVGEELRDEIVRKKSFFRVVDVKEVTNLNLEKLEEIEVVEEVNILTNDIKTEEVQEINISIIEADKVIRDLFYNTEIRGNAEEKAKDEILRVVEKYLTERG